MTATTITETRNKSSLPIWLGVSGLLFVLGVVAWIVQLRQGIGATSLHNFHAWGTYIAGFIFFMGLSAGMLVLGSLPILFNLPQFRPYSKLAAFVALISLIIGGLFVLVDIGHPDRLWRLVRFGNLGSPMLWDLLLTVAYLLVATIFLRRLMTAKSDASLKPVALLALFAGLADGLTAFVFATQVGREFWFSAVQPMAFFTAALASGAALLILLMIGLKAAGYKVLECCDLAPLVGLTAATVGLGLLLEASEIITHWFSRSTTQLEMVNAMVGSPIFWISVAAGIIAILLLVLPATRSQGTWVAVGAALALIYLALKRFVFVQMGFAVQNINYAGVEIAPTGTYTPGLVEWGVVLGLLGLFTFLLVLGFNNLRLAPTTKS
jgi:molybdopterin-containing oxidoreductase family membrane subunit